MVHSNRQRQKVFWPKSDKGITAEKENAPATNRGASKTKQCGSDNFSFGLYASQQKNQIPWHFETANVGPQQRPVDKSCQNYQIYTTNMSRNVSNFKKSGQLSFFQAIFFSHEGSKRKN